MLLLLLDVLRQDIRKTYASNPRTKLFLVVLDDCIWKMSSLALTTLPTRGDWKTCIFLPPSPFLPCLPSTVHGKECAIEGGLQMGIRTPYGFPR